MSDYLPQVVIEDILSRVPVQSLVRFRCVCKTWLSLITSPKFITLTAKNGPKLLMFRSFSPITLDDDYNFFFDNGKFQGYGSAVLPFKSNSFHYRLVGTCNGLICLYDCPQDDGDNCSETTLLWNPVIRRFIRLPRPEIDLPMAALGFGFDSKKNDFKVVRLSCKRVAGRATPPKVEVFSLNSGSWRTIPNGWDPDYGVIEDLWSQVFVNGSVHFLGYKSCDRSIDSREDRSIHAAEMDNAESYFKLQSYKGCPEEDGFGNVVLSFNLTEEEFRMIQIPPVLADMFPLDFSLGVYRDSLALFKYDVRLNCHAFGVSVMKEYGVVESWRGHSLFKDADGVWNVFGFTDGGDILAAAADNEIRCYSRDMRSYRAFRTGGFKGSLYAGSFVETLALMDLEGVRARDCELAVLLKPDKKVVADVSEAVMEEVKKKYEKFQSERLNMHYLGIAASLIGVDVLQRN